MVLIPPKTSSLILHLNRLIEKPTNFSYLLLTKLVLLGWPLPQYSIRWTLQRNKLFLQLYQLIL